MFMSRNLIALPAALCCLGAGLAAAPAAAEPRPRTLGEPARKHHKYVGSATGAALPHDEHPRPKPAPHSIRKVLGG
ncbi:hypothetical protein [Streptomyces sp. NPDC058326]|uniref:hypothetical protein n=1 Tax=Streptomyces sp. NPDC058326 TaxID=3346447 RepID=UPI0036E36CA8